MVKTGSYKFLIITLSFFFSLILGSCNFGPQPDKVIQMTLGLDEVGVGDSSQELNAVVIKLNKRLQKITKNPEVLVLLDKNQIKIKVATHYETERFKKYILNPGKLDFYETFQMNELTNFLIEVNMIANQRKDTLINPLFDLIKSAGYQGGPILFTIEEKDTAQVRKYLSLKGAEHKLPVKKRYIEFLWGTKEKETGFFPLYAVKKTRQMQPALSGDVVVDAFMNYNTLNMPVISMQMNEEGAEKWKYLTGIAYEQRSQIAIVLNDEVYSALGVSSGPIEGGRSEISGDFTVEEAQDFANILMSGEIPKMKLIDFKVEKIK